MTDVLPARVRIFAPHEIAGPPGWPEDVGIAALQVADEPEIFPVHQKESPAAILLRIEDMTGRDLGQAAVFPATEGHPLCDLPFTAVSRLQAQIESFLARTPDAVEEAADFSINFGFADEEGLDLSSLVGTSAAPRDAEPAAGPTPITLPGYAPFDPKRLPLACAIPAVLWLSASGDLVIVTDPDAAPVTLSAEDLLVRDDGLGLALKRSALADHAALPGYIVLPPACLAVTPPETGCEVLIMPQEQHYILTLAPTWPATAPPDLPVASPPTVEQPRRWPLSYSIVAVFCLVAGLAALLLIVNEPRQLAGTAEDPVTVLRAELFD